LSRPGTSQLLLPLLPLPPRLIISLPMPLPLLLLPLLPPLCALEATVVTQSLGTSRPPVVVAMGTSLCKLCCMLLLRLPRRHL